jgi:chemotaxis protein CheD
MHYTKSGPHKSRRLFPAIGFFYTPIVIFSHFRPIFFQKHRFDGLLKVQVRLICPDNSSSESANYQAKSTKMKETVDVNTGEVRLGREGTILRSVAIGSCVVIAAYDWKKKIGAMAHVMLPGSAPKNAQEKTKYADDAIDEMVDRMTRAGSDTGDIEVCLVGGGNVLKKKDATICDDNIESTTELLQRMNIPIRNSVLGGVSRKSVFLDVETGRFSYTEGDGREKPLWRPTTEREPEQ